MDVAAVLDGLAAKNPEKLDWKRSIVDLMKLVGMDSSFTARKQLAAELHYTGDPNDSASMNVWLHKQVLQKLSENGGKVPAELLRKSAETVASRRVKDLTLTRRKQRWRNGCERRRQRPKASANGRVTFAVQSGQRGPIDWANQERAWLTVPGMPKWKTNAP